MRSPIKRSSTDRFEYLCSLDVNKLHAGLDQLHMDPSNTLNFDDLNDGYVDAKSGFRETAGWWVVLDMLCHFHDMLTLRGWLAIVSFFYSAFSISF